MKIFSFLSPKCLVLFCLMASHFAAHSQTMTMRCAPNYSGPSPYKSDIDIVVTASQVGNVYYVLYNAMPNPEPDSSAVISYAKGLTPSPASMVSKGNIVVAAAGAEYVRKIANLAPHKDYFAYAAFENSNGDRSSRKFDAVHLMQAKKGTPYFYT